MSKLIAVLFVCAVVAGVCGLTMLSLGAPVFGLAGILIALGLLMAFGAIETVVNQHRD